MADIIKIHPLEYEIITKGCSAEIYLMNDEAVKIQYDSYPDIQQEYKFQKDMYDTGYPVPQPHKIAPVAFHYFYCCPTGISMERIYGKDGEEVDKNMLFVMKDAREILKSIERKLKIGPIAGYGLCPRNVMFDEKNKRVVLIDFGHWNRL